MLDKLCTGASAFIFRNFEDRERRVMFVVIETDGQ